MSFWTRRRVDIGARRVVTGLEWLKRVLYVRRPTREFVCVLLFADVMARETWKGTTMKELVWHWASFGVVDLYYECVLGSPAALNDVRKPYSCFSGCFSKIYARPKAVYMHEWPLIKSHGRNGTILSAQSTIFCKNRNLSASS